MANNDKPEVPPIQQHRSSGDTGVRQRGSNGDQDMGDDPRQAVESGEQDETNRSRGRVIDEQGEPLGKNDAKNSEAGKNEHWESGRHKAE
jgi:hypothetical protein